MARTLLPLNRAVSVVDAVDCGPLTGVIGFPPRSTHREAAWNARAMPQKSSDSGHAEGRRCGLWNVSHWLLAGTKYDYPRHYQTVAVLSVIGPNHLGVYAAFCVSRYWRVSTDVSCRAVQGESSMDIPEWSASPCRAGSQWKTTMTPHRRKTGTT